MSILGNAAKLVLPLVHPGDSRLSFNAMVDELEQEWEQTPAHERPVVLLIDMTGIGYGVWDSLRLRKSTLPFMGVTFVLPDESYNEQVIRLQSRGCGVRSSTPEGIAYAPRRCDAVATH